MYIRHFFWGGGTVFHGQRKIGLGGGAKQVLRGSGGMLEADLNFDNVKNDFSKS